MRRKLLFATACVLALLAMSGCAASGATGVVGTTSATGSLAETGAAETSSETDTAFTAETATATGAAVITSTSGQASTTGTTVGKAEANMSESAKTIVAFLGCDYEHFANTMGDIIYARYEALAAQGRKEGFTPLIILPDEILAEIFDFEFLDTVFGTGKTPASFAAWREQAIAQAAQMDAKVLLDGRLPSWMRTGSFGFAQPQTKLMVQRTVRPEEEALLVKIPTRNPWELAVWIPMGGFNECPDPMEQAAIFRYWYEQYGAVPALLMGHDLWELQLTRPPQSDADCEALAKEHYNFCPDISPPLGTTVREIASHLRGATVWQFWWD